MGNKCMNAAKNLPMELEDKKLRKKSLKNKQIASGARSSMVNTTESTSDSQLMVNNQQS